MSYPSYRISRKVKNWKKKQEEAQEARKALRPLADAFAALPDLGLDSLPAFDLDPFDHRGKEEKP